MNKDNKNITRVEENNQQVEDYRDSVYAERAQLVAFISRLYKSVWWVDPKEPEYPIVYIDLPTGQVSWHIYVNDMKFFSIDNVVQDNPWDGHTTEEKYRRLNNALNKFIGTYDSSRLLEKSKLTSSEQDG